jgi:hypothetical protein
MKTFTVPGLSVAIVKDGRLVMAKGYGVRRLGDPAPVDEHTRFGIASNTKLFTATTLELLVEEGKVGGEARGPGRPGAKSVRRARRRAARRAGDADVPGGKDHLPAPLAPVSGPRGGVARRGGRRHPGTRSAPAAAPARSLRAVSLEAACRRAPDRRARRPAPTRRPGCRGSARHVRDGDEPHGARPKQGRRQRGWSAALLASETTAACNLTCQ